MIFVFGSNLAGRHGKGAALDALCYHAAIYGQGTGLQGRSYAIPTKDEALRPLTIDEIIEHVDDFLVHAATNPSQKFQITRIGCGLAGYQDEEIAPLFAKAPKQNCFFDTKWRPYLPTGFEFWGTR